MLNPDRAELGLQPTLVPESPKKNGHIPRWLRVPAFTTRIFLATLVATPGTVIAADLITHTESPHTVYADTSIIPTSEAAEVAGGAEIAGALFSIQGIPDRVDGKTIDTAKGGFKNTIPGTEHVLAEPGSLLVGPEFPQETIDKSGGHIERFNSANQYILHAEEGFANIAGGAFMMASGATMHVEVGGVNIQLNGEEGRNWLLIVKGRFADGKQDSDLNLTARFTKYVPDHVLVSRHPAGAFISEGQFKQMAAISHDGGSNCGNEGCSKLSALLLDINTGAYSVVEQIGKDQLWRVVDSNWSGVARFDATPLPANTFRPTFIPEPTRILIPTAIRNSTEATATAADSRRLAAMNTRTAEIHATVTAQAIQSITPTPRPTPISEIRPTQVVSTDSPTTSGGSGPDLSWLWKAGIAFIAGLAANELYKRWRSKKGTTTPATSTGGSSLPPGPAFLFGRVIGALGGPSNPNTAPSTGPTQPKTPNPEWIIGQQDFEKRWQVTKGKLSPVRPGDRGDEYNYILERFTAGMGIVHEMSLDNNVIKIPKMTVRIRAGLEYAIPEIWPDSMILERFFDPGFNAGFLTAEDLAKIVYLPEQYRTLSSFTKAQAEEVRRIHSILIHALHTNNPNISKNDTDPKLQDSVDILLKRFNPAWPYIDRLIR